MPEGYDKYIEDVPNVGPQYNVGNIVGDLIKSYGGVPMSRATPIRVAPPIEQFKAMANELMAQSFTTPMAPIMGVPMPEQWRGELDAFHSRLEVYEAAVKDADPDDRKAIMDTVTIPLFFGTEGPGGLLRGADIRTPFQLANGLMLNEEWRSAWVKHVLEAVKEATLEYLPSIPTLPSVEAWPKWAKGLAVITGIALAAWTIKNLRGR